MTDINLTYFNVNKMNIRNLIIIVLSLMVITGCMKDDELWEHRLVNHQHFDGAFVLNEGNMMYENASLTYYDKQLQESFQDVFYHTNALPLGDVAHSMTLRDSLGYIVLNNSGRIYVINTQTFEYEGKITGFVSPRFIHFINDEKAYVTDLYARKIYIVNPVSLEITGHIDVNNHTSEFYQHPTEQMVQWQQYVFVNAWSFDDKILVIDSETDMLVDSITVTAQPQSMVMDENQKLWVLCDGGFAGNPFRYEEPALLRIDPSTREIERKIAFNITHSPRSLATNAQKNILYFVNKHVYKLPVNSPLSPQVFVESKYADGIGGFRGVAIDPVSSEVYITDAKDHVQPGSVYRFLPDATPVDTFPAGIIPSAIVFKPAE